MKIKKNKNNQQINHFGTISTQKSTNKMLYYPFRASFCVVKILETFRKFHFSNIRMFEIRCNFYKEGRRRQLWIFAEAGPIELNLVWRGGTAEGTMILS